MVSIATELSIFVQKLHCLQSLTPAIRPTILRLQWGNGCALQTVLEQFGQEVDRHQDIFDALDDIDRHTWVLEPDSPNRTCMYRRIALGGHSSVMMKLRVEHPAGLPECTFLGSEASIGPYRERWSHTAAALWDPNRWVHCTVS